VQPAPPDTLPVPGGDLTLRDARSGTSRSVTLLPFEIGRAPVTDHRYRFVDPAAPVSDADPAAPRHPVTWFQAVRWCNRASSYAGLGPAYEIDGRHVTWDVAADGFRLPTEAEWEWACRARTPGPTYGPLAEIAWTDGDGVDRPQPVGRKRPNDFGLVDMIGNVWEWCWDHADTARYGEYRSLRGGGWADPAWSCRASVRRGSAPDAVLEDVGFRVARGAVGDADGRAAQGWSLDADRRRAALRPLPTGWTPLAPPPDREP
jgi:formylglycine-generating enzyme required for sulfatase activity